VLQLLREAPRPEPGLLHHEDRHEEGREQAGARDGQPFDGDERGGRWHRRFPPGRLWDLMRRLVALRVVAAVSPQLSHHFGQFEGAVVAVVFPQLPYHFEGSVVPFHFLLHFFRVLRIVGFDCITASRADHGGEGENDDEEQPHDEGRPHQMSEV